MGEDEKVVEVGDIQDVFSSQPEIYKNSII